jgi:hypothetical protein
MFRSNIMPPSPRSESKPRNEEVANRTRVVSWLL